MDDGLGVVLIEVDPDFNPVAEGVGSLGGDEPEAIQLLAPLEGLANELEGEGLVDLLLVGLALGHLEDEPPSLLVLFILPFRLDALPEELDGVDSLQRVSDLVSECWEEYPFCLKSSLRKNWEREAMGDCDQKYAKSAMVLSVVTRCTLPS